MPGNIDRAGSFKTRRDKFVLEVEGKISPASERRKAVYSSAAA